MNTNIVPELQKLLDLDVPENISLGKLKEILSEYIDLMIRSDFQKLVSILYRIDVSELKLKKLLEENTNTDASSIIAHLIIERQLEKIKTRQHYGQRDENISDDERW